MRTEIRQRVIEDEVYIADDGKEFDDIDECESYENRLAGQKLIMYDYSETRCELVENCWYVKLNNQEDIEAFKAICKYDGISHKGVTSPGVYMYVEGGYGRGNDAWTNISEIVKRVEEREDNISGN